MTSSAFYEFIVNCFYPQLLENGVQFPVIIFFDGHKSHISIELHDFCIQKKIILYCFVAHASHIMQPLDVGTFRPLKVYWAQTVAEHGQRSNKIINKSNFAPLFHTAYSKLLLKPDIVKKSFEKAGLFPFNVDKVDYSKCIGYRRACMKDNVANDALYETTSNNSYNIESEIPVDILKDFQLNLLLGTMPQSEKVLFMIWKKTKLPKKYNNILNIENNSVDLKSTDEPGNNSCQLIACEDGVNMCDNVPKIYIKSNSISTLIVEQSLDINKNMDNSVMSTVNLTDINIQEIPHFNETILEEMSTSVSNGTKDTFSLPYVMSDNNETVLDRMEISESNGILKISSPPYLMSDHSQLAHSSNDVAVINDSSSVSAVISNEKFCSNALWNLDNATPFPRSTLHSPTDSTLQVDFSTIVNNDISVKKEILDKNYVENVWKESLHFPRIETTKVKKLKVDHVPTYALTSEQWKMQFLMKKNEEEKIRQEKELKKKA
ncbi:uncharacterized protein LOC106652973 [Trichogramma pretiosum]|uniref:uncharacterized protein LOC106652973 n=1 Tax=Trichogramma pretiosum TaxID=7493 RepID=UPI0006C967C6|nr:uncharacterized protein LOC106652973 [Trichogramma pretiosum]